MNESLCEACGFNHQTDTCRDQNALARWRERLAENAAQSALGKRIESRKRREIEAPLREEIESLRTALTRAEATIAKLRDAMPSDGERRWIGAALAAARLYAAGMHITEGEPLVPPNAGESEMRLRCAERWLTRLDAARKETT